jgi:hypothetical protein
LWQYASFNADLKVHGGVITRDAHHFAIRRLRSRDRTLSLHAMDELQI